MSYELRPVQLKGYLGFALLLALAGQALATAPFAPNPMMPGPYVRRPGPCVPNAQAFGYWDTWWREFPCQQRPEVKFPRSVGAEVLPTPRGQPQRPLPKAKAVPEGQARPEGAVPKSEGSGAPATGPESKPILPETPFAPGGIPSQILPQVPNLSPPLPEIPKIPAPGETRPAEPSPLPKEPAAPAPPSKGTNATVPSDGPALRRHSGEGREMTQSAIPDDHAGQAMHANWAVALAPESHRSAEAQPTSYVADAPRTMPSAALDGYCPVDLTIRQRWTEGDRRYQVVYQGQTYLFSGPQQREQFLAAPRRFAPVYSGSDPVVLAEANRKVPGRLEYAELYEGRLYLFSRAETQARFRSDPRPYTPASR